MRTDVIKVGLLQTNCYVVSDASGVCAVIDPGDDFDKIDRFLRENGLKCEWILLTHGHFDHIGALAELKKSTGARVAISEADAKYIKFAPDMLCDDGDAISAGELEFRVIATPGHTAGGVCYLSGDALFSGDTLFCDSVGRTDLPGSDFNELRESLKKLRDLPYDDLMVLPGHAESTTLRHERENNPFIEKA